MSSDDLISTGDYSDYNILDEEKDPISKNDLVWVKTKKEIWRGRVLLIPYSKYKEYREYLKIKWIDTRKENRILIKIYITELLQKKSISAHTTVL